MIEAATSRSNPFWEFSLKLYASPAVQGACLELQDASGVDVNVLLYMLWQASRGQRLSNAAAQAVVAAVEPWRLDCVVPLRTARRYLKTPPEGFEAGGAEGLRAIVKKAELEAERLQQATLYNLKIDTEPARTPLRETAAANMAAYAFALGRPLAAGPSGVMLDHLVALPTADR